MIKVLLVDDEAPARRRLRRLLESFAEIEICGEAGSGVEALDKIQALEPKAVFLDIDMPELNGFGVVEVLPQPSPEIVFVTAYDEFALKAFEACALDYLLKPVTEARLATTITRLSDRVKKADAPDFRALLAQWKPGQTTNRVAFRCGAKFLVVDPAKVSAVLARDHYAALLVEGREVLADDSLDAIIERLSPELFLRVHRGGVINLNFLQELQHEGDRKYVAVLSDPGKTRVAVSRERLVELRERLGLGERRRV